MASALIEVWGRFFIQTGERSRDLRELHSIASRTSAEWQRNYRGTIRYDPQISLLAFVRAAQYERLFSDIDNFARSQVRWPRVEDAEWFLSIWDAIQAELIEADDEFTDIARKLESASGASKGWGRLPPQMIQEAYDYEVQQGPSRQAESDRLAAHWKFKLSEVTGDDRFDEYIDHVTESIFVFPFVSVYRYIRRFHPGAVGAFHGLEGDVLPFIPRDRVIRDVTLTGKERLVVWKSNKPGWHSSRRVLGFAFWPDRRRAGGPLFSSPDGFECSLPMCRDDRVLRNIMGFLTLRPGDTDASYFDNYTAEQHDYAIGPLSEFHSQWAQEDGPPFIDR